MGQKVNPHGLRVGVIKNWGAKWYADDKQFGDLLVEDNKIRKYLKDKLYASGISKIDIERASQPHQGYNLHCETRYCNR